MLPKGTLVHVRAEALDPEHEDGGDAMGNRRQVRDHGYLWLFEGANHSNTPDDEPRDMLWNCKSLATGEIAPWFGYEFEAVKTQEGQEETHHANQEP